MEIKTHTIKDNIKSKLAQLPHSPGVYLMKDSAGRIIYVGKSKNLKNRVSSYFHGSSTSKKTENLVRQIREFDYILTDTEFEAFLLECQLIHKWRPYFNKKMKVPDSYAYIVIRRKDGIRVLDVAEEIETGGRTQYFGPIPKKYTAERVVSAIKTYFRIDCGNPYGNRPCLNHSLGKCIGICRRDVDVRDEYEKIMDRITLLLRGGGETVLQEMKREMERSADGFNFERAAEIRDVVEMVEYISKKEKAMNFSRENKPVIAIEKLDETTVKVFFMKGSRILSAKKACMESADGESFVSWVKSEAREVFNKKGTNTGDLGKNAADEAQIVYSYLKNSGNPFAIIKKDWLKKRDDGDFNAVIKGLVAGCGFVV